MQYFGNASLQEAINNEIDRFCEAVIGETAEWDAVSTFSWRSYKGMSAQQWADDLIEAGFSYCKSMGDPRVYVLCASGKAEFVGFRQIPISFYEGGDKKCVVVDVARFRGIPFYKVVS